MCGGGYAKHANSEFCIEAAVQSLLRRFAKSNGQELYDLFHPSARR
jgi:hypothetical protein